MGGESFSNTAKGKTAKDAFTSVTDEARYQHGHGGYSGTIAEKHEFRMIEPLADETPEECIRRLGEEMKPEKWNPYHDKWGPAGCIKISDDEWLFFGTASS